MYQRSRTLQRYRRRPIHGPRQGLGDVASTIGNVLNAVGAGLAAVRDPYFNEAVCLMGELEAVKAGRLAVAPCAPTPSNLPSPAGLDKAVMGLRAYVFAERNPWAYPAAVAVIVGLPLWIGFQLGKR